MTDIAHTEIRRCADGSIDLGFYCRRGRRLRALALCKLIADLRAWLGPDL